MIRDGGEARPITVIIRPPNVLVFKLKRRRTEYTLTTDVCYTMAVKAHVLDEKKRKAREKKLKKRRPKKYKVKRRTK
jgi:hypothetical protein